MNKIGRKKRIILIFLFLAVMVGVGIFILYGKFQKPSNLILVSGNIEITDAELGFEIMGKVRRISVDESDLVNEGDAIAQLDNTALSQELVLRKVEATQRRSDFFRNKNLLRTDSTSEQEFEKAKAAFGVAEEQVALAQTRLGYATLVSPLSGVVLSRNIEPGEYVSPGTPIVTVGNLDRVWLRAYINETDLGRVKVGQTVHVQVDSFPDKNYQGRISFISSEAEFTPKMVQTEEERVKLVFRIKVDIPNPNWELKPGMPADGEILISEKVPVHAGNH